MTVPPNHSAATIERWAEHMSRMAASEFVAPPPPPADEYLQGIANRVPMVWGEPNAVDERDELIADQCEIISVMQTEIEDLKFAKKELEDTHNGTSWWAGYDEALGEAKDLVQDYFQAVGLPHNVVGSTGHPQLDKLWDLVSRWESGYGATK